MLKISLEFADENSWELGISMAHGEDEVGYFRLLNVGFLLFSVCFYYYGTPQD